MTGDIIDQAYVPAATGVEQAALRRLLVYLRSIEYRFTTTTPATHARVFARKKARMGTSARDILGWGLPFARTDIDPAIDALLDEARAILRQPNGLFRSRIRVSTVHGRLFIHSAYPALDRDAVFLGPDSYRFSDLIRRELNAAAPKAGSVVVDIGTGTGVGAVMAASLCDDAVIIGTDINPSALALAQINAAEAGYDLQARYGADLAGLDDGFDIGLANPPYIIDGARRTYRDGGAMHGAEVSIAMAEAALGALRPGGRFILYTGTAIVDGADRLKMQLERLVTTGLTLRHEELDPDVFGEELDQPGYEDVERIAIVAAVFAKAP